ncbi:MAG: 4-hydroxythreonine-4-phosphate dehydrogenase PdxA [Candidatus Latescibacterota bacterium]
MISKQNRSSTSGGRHVVIAVTAGDPAGVGPEITVRLFAGFRPDRSSAILVGSVGALGPWLERAGLAPDRMSPDPGEVVGAAREAAGRVVVLDTGVADPFPVGEDSAGGGRHAGESIRLACELTRNWPVGGIVTAPISKKSLNLGEFQFPGHTEMLARYLNAPDCQMMMVCGSLRVVPLTRHLPLSEVSGRITTSLLETCVRVVTRSLEGDFGLNEPRIAVAGLNPHAGDGGVLGHEEEDVILPALKSLRERGIDAAGPVPADALFPQAYRDFQDDPARRGRYDAYIAMYHDQGLAPFKMLSQRRGVNVTVGLPVVRTSVDHGVAYDVAGTGTAETGSLLEAYKLSEELCHKRTRS